MNINKQNYWPQLDGLRALAFCLVFFHHHWAPAKILPVPLQNMLVKGAEWGWLGVDLFFILSAFLVTHLLCVERQTFGSISLQKFYARRALRIWPLFFLVVTAIAFVYPLFASHRASHLYAVFMREVVAPIFVFLGNFSLAQHFSDMQTFATASGLDLMMFATFLCPFWSLCIEEQFYILWGATTRVLKDRKWLLVCAVLIAVVGSAARIVLLTNRGTSDSTCYYMHSFWHLDTIMFGAILALSMLSKPSLFKPLRSGWLPALLAAICICGFLLLINVAPGIHSGDLMLAPVMTAFSLLGTLFLALTLHWSPLSKLLSLKWLTQIGKLTFGMYVFHYPIIWFARVGFGLSVIGINGVVSLVFSFALVLAAATVSWHVLEKPMNSLRKRLSRVHGPSVGEPWQGSQVTDVAPPLPAAELVLK